MKLRAMRMIAPIAVLGAMLALGMGVGSAEETGTNAWCYRPYILWQPVLTEALCADHPMRGARAARRRRHAVQRSFVVEFDSDGGMLYPGVYVGDCGPTPVKGEDGVVRTVTREVAVGYAYRNVGTTEHPVRGDLYIKTPQRPVVSHADEQVCPAGSNRRVARGADGSYCCDERIDGRWQRSGSYATTTRSVTERAGTPTSAPVSRAARSGHGNVPRKSARRAACSTSRHDDLRSATGINAAASRRRRMGRIGLQRADIMKHHSHFRN